MHKKEFKLMSEKIQKAQTIEEVEKLEESIENLWNNKIYNVNQLITLDEKICQKKDKLTID